MDPSSTVPAAGGVRSIPGPGVSTPAGAPSGVGDVAGQVAAVAAEVFVRESPPAAATSTVSVCPQEDVGNFVAEREICKGVWVACNLNKTEKENSQRLYMEVRTLVRALLPNPQPTKLRMTFDLASNIIYWWDAATVPPDIQTIYAHDPLVTDQIREGIKKLAESLGVTEMPLQGTIGHVSNPSALGILAVGNKGHFLHDKTKSPMNLFEFATRRLANYGLSLIDNKVIMKKLSRAATYVEHMKAFAEQQITHFKATPHSEEEDKDLHKLEAKLKLLEEINMYAVFEALARENTTLTDSTARAEALKLRAKTDLEETGLAKEKTKWNPFSSGRIMSESENEFVKVLAGLTIRNTVDYQKYMDKEKITTRNQVMAERAAVAFAHDDPINIVALFGDLQSDSIKAAFARATDDLARLSDARVDAIGDSALLTPVNMATAHNAITTVPPAQPAAAPVAPGPLLPPPGGPG